MEQIDQQSNSFTICAACPLNKKLYGTEPEYRMQAAETVRRITKAVGQDTNKSVINGETPKFIDEILEAEGTEELRREAWICNRIRLLGSCSKMVVLFPHTKYL